MIRSRYRQRTIYEAISSEVIPDYKDLRWEEWMLKVDALLENEDLVALVEKALAARCPRSRTRGRPGTPAEVVLRLLVLKHVRNWSYETVEREVRANLIYRQFTRIGGEKVPDAKTMVRLGLAIGPEVIRKIHEKIVQLARQEKVVAGRKMRVDTTVVETNIHYPTDSSLLGDGVRVLTRTIKKIEEAVGKVGTKVRDRMRSIKYRLIEIGRAARARKEETKLAAKQAYRKLMATTGKVIGQAKTFIKEVEKGIKRAGDPPIQVCVNQWAEDLKKINELTQRVLEQTKARVLEGNTHYEGKLVSIFEEQTEVIRKGKSGKPTEFGKMVKIQEAEHQIITDYEVYDQRPLDEQVLMPSIEKHRKIFERPPELVAADAAFYSAENERKAQEAGVQKVAIPNRRTRDPARRQQQKQRWFRRGQRWRVGSEGRISVLKRRHGVIRSRYKGTSGMKRWVGLGVIGDNLIHIGKWLASKPQKEKG